MMPPARGRTMGKSPAEMLRSVTRVALYGVLFTPLLASSSFLFPQLTPKGLALQILVEVAAAGAVGLWLVERRPADPIRFWPPSILGAAAVFMAVAAASAIAGVDRVRSMFGFVDRQDGLVLWLHLFGWFAVARWFFRRSGAGGASSYARTSFWISGAVAATALVEWAAGPSDTPHVFRSILPGASPASSETRSRSVPICSFTSSTGSTTAGRSAVAGGALSSAESRRPRFCSWV